MERFIRSFDPRLKIALGLLAALLTWMASPAGVVGYAVAATILLAAARLGRNASQTFKGYLLFLVLWAGLKLLFGLLDGLPPQRSLAEAGLLAGRLYVLLMVGLLMSASSSPRSLGLAASWFLRPLGRWTWQPALALALMVHFLPLAWQTFTQVRSVIGMRCPGLPFHQRLSLMAQASLRAMAQKTWDQTLALAARDLDAPEAWRASMPWKARDLIVGLGVAASLVWLAWM